MIKPFRSIEFCEVKEVKIGRIFNKISTTPFVIRPKVHIRTPLFIIYIYSLCIYDKKGYPLKYKLDLIRFTTAINEILKLVT